MGNKNNYEMKSIVPSSITYFPVGINFKKLGLGVYLIDINNSNFNSVYNLN